MKIPHKCIKYSIILCLMICIIYYSQSKKIENYSDAHFKQFKKVSFSTKYNDDGGGNVAYLDRHTVQCDGLISQFKLNRSKDGKQYTYEYQCLNKGKDDKMKITKKGQTEKVKPSTKSMDLVGKELNCYDTKDADVGLVSFAYRNKDGKAYYDYTCGKVVKKTPEELKKEKDDKAAKQKKLKDDKAAKEAKINKLKPTKPGCYVYNEKKGDKRCDGIKKGQWNVDHHGHAKYGSFFDEKKCQKRVQNFNDWCKVDDFRAHHVKYTGKNTKPYSHGDGNTVYLDGHNVDCNGKFVKKFNLKQLGKNYTYLFKCS